MRTPTIDDDQLLDRLTEVFRVHGYEGASLSRISEATGLQRASLYHRFPGGKEEMAEAVLRRADDWFISHILAPLSDDQPPSQRVERMAKRLAHFYDSGEHSCLLDSLSLGDAEAALQCHVEQSFTAWLGAMTAVARAAGATAAVAKRQASDALVQIQGGLVFSRVTGDTRPFRRVLKNLPELLTGAGVKKPG